MHAIRKASIPHPARRRNTNRSPRGGSAPKNAALTAAASGALVGGSAEIVAAMIAKEVSADTFCMQTVNAYPERYDECTEAAKQERDQGARPELASMAANAVSIKYWLDYHSVIHLSLSSYSHFFPGF